MPLPLSTMKFEALPLFAITVVDNNGHVNDLVQRLDDPDEPAQQGHHPRGNAATVKTFTVFSRRTRHAQERACQ